MIDDTRHISSLFDEELIDLNNDVARLGALAESQLGQVMEAVRAHDKSNLETVINKDKELDEIEAGLNEKAITMIALRAPLAEDLRHVIVALKVATILERTGDYAKNIAKRMLKIDDKDLLNGTKALGTMGNIVQEMLNNVLDAYMEKMLIRPCRFGNAILMLMNCTPLFFAKCLRKWKIIAFRLNPVRICFSSPKISSALAIMRQAWQSRFIFWSMVRCCLTSARRLIYPHNSETICP